MLCALTAVPARSAGRPPAELSRLPTGEKVVALTIDCGGNAAGLSRMLRALARAGAPATFFLTGRFAERYPRRARRIAARYPIGNHTYDHPDLTLLPATGVVAEVRRAARVLRRITRHDPRPLFRFPYGARDGRTLSLVHGLGYSSVLWTIDTLGWRGRSGGSSAGVVVARVLAGLRPGAIVLLHAGAATDGTALDAQALPRVIRALRARGYSLVTVRPFLRRS